MHTAWFALPLFVLVFAGCAENESDASDPTQRSVTASKTTQPPATPTGASPAKGTFKLDPFVSGLESPLYLTHAGDASGRVFIVEQAGRILIARDGALSPVPFLDIKSKVLSGGERGLLSVAFYEDYETSGRFVVYYTRATTKVGMDAESVVARYKVGPNSDVADPASEEVLLTFDQPQSNHNGGLVKFGPDGMLYIGSGDGGNRDDLGPGHSPEGNGQNLDTLLGKLLRIDVSGPGAYKIPADNPNLGPNARKEIWAYGLRNPWRFSFDRATGDLYIGDVGQNAWEEIDFQPKSSKGGENYGWPQWEGTHAYPHPGPGLVGDVKPVAEYQNPTQGRSVTGGYVYRGSSLPALTGYYILGDYVNGNLWTLAKVSDAWSLSDLIDTQFFIASFGEDEAGELYLVNHRGTVQKFTPT